MGPTDTLEAADVAVDSGVCETDSSIMDVLSMFVGRPHSPTELLRVARHLVQEAVVAITDGACPADRPGGVPRRLPEVHALEDVVRESELLKWVSEAAQAHALARYAATDNEMVNADNGWSGRVEYPIGHIADDADLDIGPVCDWSARAAASRLADGVRTVTLTPTLLRLAGAGEVATWRVRVVASELGNTAASTATRVEAQIMACRGWRTWSMGKLQRTTRGLVQQWEPEAAKESARKSNRQVTGVSFGDSLLYPGLGELVVAGPKEELAALYQAIDALAHERHAAGDRLDTGSFLFDPDRPDQQELLMGQQRFRAFRDLINANATVSYELVVQVPVVPTSRRDNPVQPGDPAAGQPGDATTPAGRAGPAAAPGAARGPDSDSPDSDGPVEPAPAYRAGWGRIPGVGLVDPQVVLAMLDAFGWDITRASLDADTGVTIETASAGYVPPGRMRRFAQLRHGACTAPGCERDASNCDLDHVIPWPVGETSTKNLAPACRRHHNTKTKRRWSYVLHGDGTCAWTSPTGREFTTYPEIAYDDQTTPWNLSPPRHAG